MLHQNQKKTAISTQKRKYWTYQEDKLLEKAVKLHNSNWKTIAEYFIGRNGSQCSQRWKRIKPPTIEKKNFWTPAEDDFLRRLVTQHKFEWKKITSFMQNRTTKQVRERYINHLDPLINKRPWTLEEDQSLWSLYQQYGPKWSKISQILQGRPENTIKNRFYGHIRKFYAKLENPYYIVPIRNRSMEKDFKQVMSNKNFSSISQDNKSKQIHSNNKKILLNQEDEILDISFQSYKFLDSKIDIQDEDIEEFSDSGKHMIEDSHVNRLCKSFTQEFHDEDSFLNIENRIITQTFEFYFYQSQQSTIDVNQSERIFENENLK
ncbi:unnamed protein product [Paramecium sonneborni]|uniref:Myb-like DNA-binding domain containing protein n=1 Tax=Paramecium sonneborni TaxID=65129 RepID=A0A8S1N737_9CILI|nr:unnamed protein product [Paramecium sonneborni]